MKPTIACIIAFVSAVLLGANPTPPALTMPPGWVQTMNKSDDRGVALAWSNNKNPQDHFAGIVAYYAWYKSSVSESAAQMRRLVTCSDSDAGRLMASIHVCGGIVVDTDEQCGPVTAHELTRIANLGPPMLMADTNFYIPWGYGLLSLNYQRPATQYTKGTDDDVMTAIRALCASLH